MTHTDTPSRTTSSLTALPRFPAAGSGTARCATPECHNRVDEAWEETGTLCATCAIEGDLADRIGRWDRVFATVH